MPFNERSRLDTSQVEDRRGRGLGTAIAAGGGGLGLVVLLVAVLLGVNPGALAGGLGKRHRHQLRTPAKSATWRRCA